MNVAVGDADDGRRLNYSEGHCLHCMGSSD